jgi:hypothetical protein
MEEEEEDAVTGYCITAKVITLLFKDGGSTFHSVTSYPLTHLPKLTSPR